MKTLGKVALAILLFVLIVAGVMFFRWQASKAEDPDATFVLPRLHMVQLELERFDMVETQMLMELRIDQPAPLPLDLDSLTYVIYLDTVEIARSTYPHSVSIPAMGSGTIRTPFISFTNKLMAELNRLEELGTDSVDHVLVATFHAPLMFWKNEPVEIRLVEHLPAYRIPKISMRDPKIEKFGLNESRITMDVALYNPNPFAYRFKETEFQIRVKENEMLYSRIDSLIELSANDTTLIHLPLELSAGRALRSVWDLVFSPNTPYDFTMSTTIVSNTRSINNSYFEMKGDGTLKELKCR